jgi:predicted enzyme related to lactoylglutathione lyase
MQHHGRMTRALRTYARLYVQDLDVTLAALAPIVGQPVSVVFEHPTAGLRLAALGGLLLVAGPPERLAAVRDTQATVIVDDLDGLLADLQQTGAQVLRGPTPVPTGRNVTVRHPGDAIIEYVEWSQEMRHQQGL